MWPSGPVFLDAECAWWGDPRSTWRLPESSAAEMPVDSARGRRILCCFDALSDAYLRVSPGIPDALEQRAAALLLDCCWASRRQITGRIRHQRIAKAQVRRVHARCWPIRRRAGRIRAAWKKKLTHDRHQHRLRARAPGVDSRGRPTVEADVMLENGAWPGDAPLALDRSGEAWIA